MRQELVKHCKFGEVGMKQGQLSKPGGVAVNAQDDIIVADTDNHRIQIFDKEGRFKLQFGECGLRDGELMFPNRVAVAKVSGDIIVTERPPVNQVQIYNTEGQFVRKFGADLLKHPRGVTVDRCGFIVVVDSQRSRVIIFFQSGSVLQNFDCSKHLEFPNGVAVNDKKEIFITDFHGHCVKVFSYRGHFLRQIGDESFIKYPMGIGINASGEILVTDNHRNFHLTIFSQLGQVVSALESSGKHTKCLDIAVMNDGFVVLATMDLDNRLYIYRYAQDLPIGS